MQRTVVVWADWTLHPWCHNSSNVGVVTAGQVIHNSSTYNILIKYKYDNSILVRYEPYYIVNSNNFYVVDTIPARDKNPKFPTTNSLLVADLT